MISDLATAAVCLVCSVWGTYALLRGEQHITARLAATVSLVIAASFGYAASQGRSNVVMAVALVVFTLTMFAIGLAKGRFHIPRH